MVDDVRSRVYSSSLLARPQAGKYVLEWTKERCDPVLGTGGAGACMHHGEALLTWQEAGAMA